MKYLCGAFRSSFLGVFFLLLVVVWFGGGGMVETALGFAPAATTRTTTTTTRSGRSSSASSSFSSSSSSSTCLYAIGALVKKAKLAELRESAKKSGVPDDVMEHYQTIQQAAPTIDLLQQQQQKSAAPGPLQESLTKRKGTLTVVAEYRRKMNIIESNEKIPEAWDAPELLSPLFRESGASAISVLADERLGGCNYDDLNVFVEEQRRAHSQVPGPIPVINHDLILDELQIAQSKTANVAAVVLDYDIIGSDDDLLVTLAKAAAALELETIVSVSNNEQAKRAINELGVANILLVNVDGLENKLSVIQDIPDSVCKIANIWPRPDQQLQEIEDAWAVRDKGFQCAWIGEALYKTGTQTEHPGAIIRAMKSKSSLKWASPTARSGRGEGAREYLGDIMM